MPSAPTPSRAGLHSDDILSDPSWSSWSPEPILIRMPSWDARGPELHDTITRAEHPDETLDALKDVAKLGGGSFRHTTPWYVRALEHSPALTPRLVTLMGKSFAKIPYQDSGYIWTSDTSGARRVRPIISPARLMVTALRRNKKTTSSLEHAVLESLTNEVEGIELLSDENRHLLGHLSMLLTELQAHSPQKRTPSYDQVTRPLLLHLQRLLETSSPEDEVSLRLLAVAALRSHNLTDVHLAELTQDIPWLSQIRGLGVHPSAGQQTWSTLTNKDAPTSPAEEEMARRPEALAVPGLQEALTRKALRDNNPTVIQALLRNTTRENRDPQMTRELWKRLCALAPLEALRMLQRGDLAECGQKLTAEFTNDLMSHDDPRIRRLARIRGRKAPRTR